MNASVKMVPTLATYQAPAIRVRMTRIAPNMGCPSIREWRNYSSAPTQSLTGAFEPAAVGDDGIADLRQEGAHARGVPQVLVRDDPQFARQVGQHRGNPPHLGIAIGEVTGKQRNADPGA